jgi:hypothetical protein
MPSREEATTVDARTVEEIAAAEVATEEQLTSPFWLDTGRALGRKAELAPLPGQRPGPSLTPDDGDDGSSGMLDWVGLRTPHSIGKLYGAPTYLQVCIFLYLCLRPSVQ